MHQRPLRARAAVVLLLAAVVSPVVSSAAEASPDRRCEMLGHHCDDRMAAPCCCCRGGAGESSGPATPQPLPVPPRDGNTGPSPAAVTMPAPLLATPCQLSSYHATHPSPADLPALRPTLLI
jgi:hypothetical protein